MFQAIPENVADDWKLVLYILSLQFDDILIIANTNPGVWRKCESDLANAEEYDRVNDEITHRSWFRRLGEYIHRLQENENQ